MASQEILERFYRNVVDEFPIGLEYAPGHYATRGLAHSVVAVLFVGALLILQRVDWKVYGNRTWTSLQPDQVPWIMTKGQ